MSQQALDLRTSVRIVRRHKKVFGVIVALCLLGGVGYGVLNPPMLTSTALVVLPQAAVQGGQAAQPSSTSSPDASIATEVVIASSNEVLSLALPHVSPHMSLQALKDNVTVSNPAGSIISISATGKTALEAETTANAVANSYISYVATKNSPGGQVSVRMLESATSATGSSWMTQISLFAIVGLLAGTLLGVIVSLVINRRDHRLVARDAIANSIGAPVLAALPAERPSDAVSWAKLFDQYNPGPVHGWTLAKLMRQFGIATVEGANPRSTALTILSLSSDPRALALGPQLASFAADQGVPTALVVGPQQDTNVTATLRTACGAPSQGLRKPLQLIVADGGAAHQPRAALIVVVEVVDSQAPLVSGAIRTNVTVLAVSAGGATAEQLARAAAAAAADGREVAGILVANPDPSDQTTGLIPRLAPPTRRPLPTRVTGLPTESRR